MQSFGVWKNSPVALELTVWKRRGKIGSGEPRIFGLHFWKIKNHQTTLLSQHLLCRALVFEKIPPVALVLTVCKKREKIGSEEPRIFGRIFGRSNTTKLPSGVSNYYAEFWCLNKYLPVALVLTVWERGGKKILGSCEFLGCIFGRSKTIKTPSGFSIYYAEFWYLKKNPPVVLVLTVWKRRGKIGSGEPRIFGLHFWKIKNHQTTLLSQHLLCRVLVFEKILPVALVLTVWKKREKIGSGEPRNNWSQFLEDQRPPNSPQESSITMQSFGVWTKTCRWHLY